MALPHQPSIVARESDPGKRIPCDWTPRESAWRLKRRLGRHPLAYSLCKNLWYFRYAVRQGLWRALLGLADRAQHGGLQQVITWDVPFPQFNTPAELSGWLQSRGIRLCEGKHALYIPPQPALNTLIPFLPESYPAGAGFKILKDFRGPDEANYVHGDPGAVVRCRMIGTPRNQLVTANYLYSLGLGPRLWDICCWCGEGVRYCVFVVDHIAGRFPSYRGCSEFVSRLKQLSKASLLRVLVPAWQNTGDFLPPDCNGNLLQPARSGRPLYVDFQNFRVSDPRRWTHQIARDTRDDVHFRNASPHRADLALGRIAGLLRWSGRQNAPPPWASIIGGLQRHHVDLRGRLVLDVGCNSGLMLHASLAAGAMWGLGWDQPSVVRWSEKLLLSLGTSRFSLTGARLGAKYPIENDVPDHLKPTLKQSVVFCRPVGPRNEIVESIGRIPWRILVCHARQGEADGWQPHTLERVLVGNIRHVATMCLADEDGCTRCAAVYVRCNADDRR